MNAQSKHQPEVPPDEYMQDVLESLSMLRKCFGDDDGAVKAIDRETCLANQWIDATEPPELKVGPRALGAVEPSDERRGKRVNGARRLIATGTPISEAALEMGFADQAHLQRAFKARHAMTPGRYRAHPQPV